MASNFARWAALIWICCSLKADQLAVSPLNSLQAPPLTRYPLDRFNFGTVAVSGTNAVFVWSRAGGEPGQHMDSGRNITNFFLTQIDQSGQPLDAPARFVVSAGYGDGRASLFPADDGFFMMYNEVRSLTNTSDFVVTRISAGGAPMFTPVPVATKPFKNYAAASNGRSFLFLGGAPTTGLPYTLLDYNGQLIKSGIVSGVSNETLGAVSNGKDYLLLLQSSTPPTFRVTRLLASGEIVSTVGFTNFSGFNGGYGKNGYLITGGDQMLQLADDGSEIRRGRFSMPLGDVIYPDGEDWVTFQMDSLGSMRSFRVAPDASTLHVTLNPYPSTSGLLFSPLMLRESIVPFGSARFLVARNNGFSILDKTGVTPAAIPISYARQTWSRVVSSPFGYLVAWQESDIRSSHIRLIRMATDGTRLDREPLSLGNGTPNTAPTSVFDGDDYVVGWFEGGATFSTRLARISPLGAPDVRVQEIEFPTGPVPFSLISNKGNLYAWRWGGSSANADLHIFPIAAFGAIGEESIVHGQFLVSDGANLYSIGLNGETVYTQLIMPDSIPAELHRTTIAAGSAVTAASLRNAFALAWVDAANNWTYAYMTNGVEQFRSAWPSQMLPQFASTFEKLLVASRQQVSSYRLIFRATDLRTGESVSTDTDFGTFTGFNLAGGDKDFFGVTDSLGFQMDYAGGFWVTTSPIPAIGTPSINDGGLKATLNLDSERRYRIEISNDLLNWDLMEVVSNLSEYTVDVSGGEKQFVRAVLVPE